MMPSLGHSSRDIKLDADYLQLTMIAEEKPQNPDKEGLSV